MSNPSQYQQQQTLPSTPVAYSQNLYGNSSPSALRKPSPIRRTQSFDVNETNAKHFKRRSQTQINSPNLPQAQAHRATRSISINNVTSYKRQGSSIPDPRGLNLGGSPSCKFNKVSPMQIKCTQPVSFWSGPTSPSRTTKVSVITNSDPNLCKAICSILSITNKTPEILADEIGAR